MDANVNILSKPKNPNFENGNNYFAYFVSDLISQSNESFTK